MNTIRSLASRLPSLAGCYVMRDVKTEVIYVGKAKNLRKRVASYWRAQDAKTSALVAEIADIEYVVTNNEVEALILEMQLIQKYHPKYNIDLQSPGRYAYIKITHEDFPRLLIARKIEKDKAIYIGPFPSGAARNAVLKEAFRIFGLCKQRTRTGKPCFRYHLGQCSGSCVGTVPSLEYRATVKQAEKFLKGDYGGAIRETKEKMFEASKSQRYEQAKIYRDQLFALEHLEEQKVSHPKRFDQDVVNYLVAKHLMTFQLFHFAKGIIAGRKEYALDLDRLNVSSPQHALQEFLLQYYSANAVPSEIIIPCALPEQKLTQEYLERVASRSVRLLVPQKGMKKSLLDMVKKNLLSQFGESGGRLYELSQALHIKDLPVRMVCIDISHLSGTETVGSLVHFVNGQPAKSEYRKFIIRSVEGVNDVASIHEVVLRYGRRILEEKEKKPDLIVIDGGRGQLNSALKALASLNVRIPTIGLAKRLEEIYVSWASVPLHLHPKNPGLQLLRAIRDEAHRFAITFQRKRRK